MVFNSKKAYASCPDFHRTQNTFGSSPASTNFIVAPSTANLCSQDIVIVNEKSAVPGRLSGEWFYNNERQI